MSHHIEIQFGDGPARTPLEPRTFRVAEIMSRHPDFIWATRTVPIDDRYSVRVDKVAAWLMIRLSDGTRYMAPKPLDWAETAGRL